MRLAQTPSYRKIKGISGMLVLFLILSTELSARNAYEPADRSFAGTKPVAGVTHFDNAFSATGNLLLTSPSPQTVANVGDPVTFPGIGLFATGWDFTVTSSGVGSTVSLSVQGMGATGTLPTTSDFCIRMNRQTAGETVQTVAINTNDHSHVQLLSISMKATLIPNNPTTLVDITLTGYRNGNPVAGAVKTITGIHTTIWTSFDVSAIPGFTGVDEFRFTQAATTTTVISNLSVDEIALPTTPFPSC